METDDGDLIRGQIVGFLITGNQKIVQSEGGGDAGVVWVIGAHRVGFIDYDTDFAVAFVGLASFLGEGGREEQGCGCQVEEVELYPAFALDLCLGDWREYLHLDGFEGILDLSREKRVVRYQSTRACISRRINNLRDNPA